MSERVTDTAPERRDAPTAPAAAPAGALVEMTLVRFREFLREPEAVFWVFVFPILLAFALGIAFRSQPPAKPRVAVDGSSTAASALRDALAGSGAVDAEVLAPDEAAAALRTGRVDVVVRGDGAASPSLGGSSVNYRFDPTRPESRTARLVAADALERAAGRRDVTSAEDVLVSEPGSRYIDWLIPGLIGMNLMGSGLWGLGFSVVTARTRKVLKRLAATPMRRSHFLLSYMMSRLTFLALEVAAVLVFAWIAFGVTVRGSIAALAAVALVGSLTFAGIGLLVAARPRTIEGVSGLMNLVMLPMWLLSGTFFSAERFPAALQPAIKLLPLTALNTALRGVINEGFGLATLAAPMAILVAWAAVSFVVALKIFRWQ